VAGVREEGNNGVIEVMTSSDIQCAYCGLKGKMEDSEFQLNNRDVRIFKHRGHNPYSGHLHYQCPSCSIILLVLPMDVPDGKSLREAFRQAAKNDPVRMVLPSAVDKLTGFRKIIQSRLLDSLHN
jgi:hypothetical protein